MIKGRRPSCLAEKAWARKRQKQKFSQPDDVWNQWITTRDPKHKGTLAEHNSGLCREAARRWQAMSEIEYDDLYQLANIGLLKAIDRFDPGLGNAFSSFAMVWVKGEILHFLRDKGRLYSIPRQAREIRAAVRRTHRLLTKSGGEATELEVAIASGYSQAEWEWICQATEKRTVSELNEAIHVAADEPDYERQQLHEQLMDALMTLPNPGRKFLIESVWKGLSHEAIAKKERCSLEHVQTQISLGLSTLRDCDCLAEMRNETC